MNEFLIYAGISIFSLLLFYLWYRRQGKATEKQWLTQKIASSSGEEQQQYADVLGQLTQHKPNFTTTLWVAILIVPTAFVIDYVWFHEIPIEQRVSVAEADAQVPDLATAIRQLEQKLTTNPDDLQGQLLYARAMMSTQQYEYAVGAYRKASSLDPANANILADLAEAIAFKNNTGSFLGEPEQYLVLALEIDPKNQKGMWLQGIVYYEKQQFQAAEDIWSELLIQVDNPNIRATINKQINQARAGLNKPPLAEADSQVDASTAYFVVIDASEAVKELDLGVSARLFVFAEEVDGPPMPIAAVPIQAPFSWPMSVTISDQNSLNPNRKLSDFSEVKFSAKLSLTGNATPAENDIKSASVVADNNQQSIQLTLNN